MTETPKPQPNPREPGYIKMPDGSFRGIFELTEYQKTNEAELDASFLRAGDLLAAQYTRRDGSTEGLAFEVTGVEWDSLGISYSESPSPKITGKLETSKPAEEFSGQEVVFSGSGWGGSSIQPGLIGTDRCLYFRGKGKEYLTPFLTNFEIFRPNPDSGELKPIEPNQLVAESRIESATHRQRLQAATELMQLFGFRDHSIKDFGEPSEEDRDGLVIENRRYLAEYTAGAHAGNALTFVDKKIGQWTKIKYWNESNEDTLQVASGKLSGRAIGKLSRRHPAWLGGILSLDPDPAITTATTSSVYGIEAVNYEPSKREAVKVLGIPIIGDKKDGHIYAPDIQLLPDGKVRIPTTIFPITALELQHPGLIKGIEDSTTYKVDSRQNITLNIKGHPVKLENPDAVIDNTISKLRKIN